MEEFGFIKYEVTKYPRKLPNWELLNLHSSLRILNAD
jgi:hypothetical protein